jgi:hypothetical protein
MKYFILREKQPKLIRVTIVSYPPARQLRSHHTTAPMAGPTTRARASWIADRVTALPEFWALVALHLGLVGAWRLMLVCKAARVGVKDFLKTLPGLVVSGGVIEGGVAMEQVWRLDLATLQWEAMPALVDARCFHACCAVRDNLFGIGGATSEATLGSVEMLAEGEGAFTAQPPLTCGGLARPVAIEVIESGSAAGQVLLLGGYGADGDPMSTVYLVDLATGVCTPQPNLLSERCQFTAARLPDGRIVCAGGLDFDGTVLSSVEVCESPALGAMDAAWTRRELPAMSAAREGCRGCVMSDGRFAVLGGMDANIEPLSSCEVLVVGHDEHWEVLPPMHEARSCFACAAVAGCIIVAGGGGRTPNGAVLLRSAEVFDEVLGRWRHLPCDLPYNGGLVGMGSALI